MQSNTTCPILEQYLSYLSIIKGRSSCTIREYRTDILAFLWWIAGVRKIELAYPDFAFADVHFLETVTLGEMYSFIAYCQNERHSSPGTRARKIVSIRQFWKYLKRSHILQVNIAEELETPKQPKRIPRHLSLEESVRLLIVGKTSPRDHCILTILLNCALRISELEALNCSQVSSDVLSVIGKGNKERKIYLTPAAKSSITAWLEIRNFLPTVSDALFISKSGNRLTVRSLQVIVKKYVRLAGFNDAEISAHTLRHTSATLMYKYGRVDIRSLQQILGHESVATTEIYTHIDDSQLQAAVNSNPLAIMFS